MMMMMMMHGVGGTLYLVASWLPVTLLLSLCLRIAICLGLLCSSSGSSIFALSQRMRLLRVGRQCAVRDAGRVAGRGVRAVHVCNERQGRRMGGEMWQLRQAYRVGCTASLLSTSGCSLARSLSLSISDSGRKSTPTAAAAACSIYSCLLNSINMQHVWCCLHPTVRHSSDPIPRSPLNPLLHSLPEMSRTFVSCKLIALFVLKNILITRSATCCPAMRVTACRVHWEKFQQQLLDIELIYGVNEKSSWST